MTRFLKLPFQLFWKLLKALQTLLFGLIALGLFLALIAAPFSDNASQMPEDGALFFWRSSPRRFPTMQVRCPKMAPWCSTHLAF